MSDFLIQNQPPTHPVDGVPAGLNTNDRDKNAADRKRKKRKKKTGVKAYPNDIVEVNSATPLPETDMRHLKKSKVVKKGLSIDICV